MSDTNRPAHPNARPGPGRPDESARPSRPLHEPLDARSPPLVGVLSHWLPYLLDHDRLDALPVASADLYGETWAKALPDAPPFRVYMGEDGGAWLSIDGGDAAQSGGPLPPLLATVENRRCRDAGRLTGEHVGIPGRAFIIPPTFPGEPTGAAV